MVCWDDSGKVLIFTGSLGGEESYQFVLEDRSYVEYHYHGSIPRSFFLELISKDFAGRILMEGDNLDVKILNGTLLDLSKPFGEGSLYSDLVDLGEFVPMLIRKIDYGARYQIEIDRSN
jgi:hypothetical protein